MVTGNEKKAEKSAEFGVKAVSEFGHGHVEFGSQVELEAGRGRGLCSGMPALKRLRGHSRPEWVMDDGQGDRCRAAHHP